MNWADRLRRELANTAKQYAERRDIPHYFSLGSNPTVMFEPYNGNAMHGNFMPLSFQAILNHRDWRLRLNKRHPRLGALPASKRDQARELDSSNSSDALLMNIFCFPGSGRGRPSRAFRLFGESLSCLPEFGVPGLVPLVNGSTDATEIDMRLGKALVEAKLTEPNFTAKPKAGVTAYRDFEEVFETAALPQNANKYMNYQLIRNVLAAFAYDLDFFLLCDSRRPDLLRPWWEVMRCIKLAELRSRCEFVFWQELAAEVPEELSAFLTEKYGVRAT